MVGSITIRKLNDMAKRNARQVAASKGRSLESELRDLIERTYGVEVIDDHGARIRAMTGAEFIDHLIKTANGATLELPERTNIRESDVFGAG